MWSGKTCQSSLLYSLSWILYNLSWSFKHDSFKSVFSVLESTSTFIIHLRMIWSPAPSRTFIKDVSFPWTVCSPAYWVSLLDFNLSYSTMIQLLVPFCLFYLAVFRMLNHQLFRESDNCPWIWTLIIVFYNKDNSFIISYLTKIIYIFEASRKGSKN